MSVSGVSARAKKTRVGDPQRVRARKRLSSGGKRAHSEGNHGRLPRFAGKTLGFSDTKGEVICFERGLGAKKAPAFLYYMAGGGEGITPPLKSPSEEGG